MDTSKGLMLTGLALYTNVEAPVGSIPHRRAQNGEGDAPEAESPERVALRSILGRGFAQLAEHETVRPDRDVPALYDSLRAAATKREVRHGR